jgi:hypothetical protein
VLKTLFATYDGQVFTPEENLNLRPNERYLIQIELNPKQNVFQKISARAKDLGISNLANQHDHYLYGTEKQ